MTKKAKSTLAKWERELNARLDAELEAKLATVEDETDESADEVEPEGDEPREDWAAFEKKLEADRKAFHAEREKNGGKLDAAKLRDLTARQEKLDAEKARAAKEASVKALWKKRYLAETFCSERDFEILWKKSLRFDAMKAQIETKTSLREAKQATIYRKF
jgi:hypothetical protein